MVVGSFALDIINASLFLSSLSMYRYPTEEVSAEDMFMERCGYDTKELCPDCFPKPFACHDYMWYIRYNGTLVPKAVVKRFDQHSIPNGILFDDQHVVINNLNRKEAIEKLRTKICRDLDPADYCLLTNDAKIIKLLRREVLDVLDRDRSRGAVICPTGDEGALSRFVQQFDQPELMSLLLMATNSQSLIVRLGSRHHITSVPSFVFQGGFILVERYEGAPLTNFYQSETRLQLKIANKLMSAILKLNSNVDNFRILLMDVNPADIIVNVRNDDFVLSVTFAALDNVVIFNELNVTQQNCTAPPGRGQKCLCKDMNLIAVCKLLLENQSAERGKGFLHFYEQYEEYFNLRQLLQHCAYCNPNICVDRRDLLGQIQAMIYKILNFL